MASGIDTGPRHDQRPRGQGAARWLTMGNVLLLAVPLAVVLRVLGVRGTWMFLGAGLGIVPLAGLIGRATEALASRAGPQVGGLLNATFGNAAELIIALILLSRGPDLYPVVRATLTGSLMGNLLLVLGTAFLAGGLRFPRLTFNRTSAAVGTTLMAIAAAGLLLPTLFYYLPHPGFPPAQEQVRSVENLSEEISVVLLILYGLNLVFSLWTHPDLLGVGSESEPEKVGERWGTWTAVGVLCGATAAVAVLSEWLVGTIEPAATALGMNEVFVGVIVVAIVGNAAEHFSAVQMAWRGQTEVAVQIAVGSSTQVALFVAPVLVFASLAMGHAPPLDLHFTPLEVVAVGLCVALVALVAHDGEANWLEGAMLLALYLLLALAFYNYIPRSMGS